MIPVPVPEIKVEAVMADRNRWVSHYAVTINGESIKQTRSISGVRRKFISRKWGVIIKVDSGKGLDSQCGTEAMVWQVVDPEDRKHFAPILAHGTGERPGPYDTKGHFSWNVQPLFRFSPRQVGAVECPHKEEIVEAAKAIFAKYELMQDYHWSQFKVRRSGIVIHDYGFCKSPKVRSMAEVG